MRNQYYVKRIKQIFKRTHYEELNDIVLCTRVLEILHNIIFDDLFERFVREHSIDLMRDSIKIVKNEEPFTYTYSNVDTVPRYNGPIERKLTEMMNKENYDYFYHYKMNKNIISEFMHLVGADDFINDKSKSYILEKIEWILMETYDDHLNLQEE